MYRKVPLQLLFGLLLSITYCRAQTPPIYKSYISPEIAVGKTTPSNMGFPDTNLFSGGFIAIGKNNTASEKEWLYRLGYPKTGIILGYGDYGNSRKIGQSFSAMPFIDFQLTKKITTQAALGVGYFNTKFDPLTNPNNRAISTSITWSFRSMVYYNISQTSLMQWKAGLGYYHQSNGHTRLPNQGLNTFTASIATTIPYRKKDTTVPVRKFERSTYYQFSIRYGQGINAFSEIFNDRKDVNTLHVSLGKVINNTFKFEIGAYYRFYEHYYDYINAGQDLIETHYPELQEHPFYNASTYGIAFGAEVLMNHIGFDIQIGANFSKPTYKVDWLLNEGFFFESGGETIRSLGERNWYFEVKKIISSRMGFKYYIIGTEKRPKHNFYLGAHINANLGQADFTELSVGYVLELSKNK